MDKIKIIRLRTREGERDIVFDSIISVERSDDGTVRLALVNGEYIVIGLTMRKRFLDMWTERVTEV